MFTKDELAVLTLLYLGKSTKDHGETLESLKTKLDVARTGDLLERFQGLTGWSNSPKDYA